jgi:hypothetical protein
MNTRVILTLLVVVALSFSLFATPAISGGGATSSGDDDRWGNTNAAAAGDESDDGGDADGGGGSRGGGSAGRACPDTETLRFELRVLIDALVIIIVP